MDSFYKRACLSHWQLFCCDNQSCRPIYRGRGQWVQPRHTVVASLKWDPIVLQEDILKPQFKGAGKNYFLGAEARKGPYVGTHGNAESELITRTLQRFPRPQLGWRGPTSKVPKLLAGSRGSNPGQEGEALWISKVFSIGMSKRSGIFDLFWEFWELKKTTV